MNSTKGNTSTTATATGTTTPSESDVYDRQIRLWGAEAQKKLRNSTVLYIHLTGASSEVLKNLVLAGIAATLCDSRPASALHDVSRCFFTPHSNDPQDRLSSSSTSDNFSSKKMKYDTVAHSARLLIEELNPLLGSCSIVTKEVSELTEEDLNHYHVVVASRVSLTEIVRLSQIVTSQGHAFFTVDCFGMRGAAMIDLGRGYQYRPEIGNKLGDLTKLKEYVPLSDIVSFSLHQAINRFHKHPPPTWILYRSLLEYQRLYDQWLGDETVDCENAKASIQNFLKEQQVSLADRDLDDLVVAGMAQVAPVCAVIGGFIGNEVIKVITRKGEPANNSVLFDGDTCKAWSFLVTDKDQTSACRGNDFVRAL